MARKALEATRDARLAYATTVVGISAVSLSAPVLPELATTYGVSLSRIALMQVAVLVPGVLSARWLLGPGARGGLHHMLGLALLGYGIPGGLLLAVTAYPVVLALRLLQGIACGGLVAGAFALLGSGDADRDRRISRNAALICLMMAIQPLLGSALSAFGPRGPFAFYLAAIPLGVVMLRVAGTDPPQRATMRQRHAAAGASKGEVLVTTAVVNALLFGWLLYLAPVVLADRFELAVHARGLVLSGQSLLGAGLALVAARVLRRGRQRALLYAGLVLPLLGLATVAAAMTPAVAIAGFVLVGTTYGTANPGILSMATGWGQQATGAWQSSARLGQVLGPATAAWLLARQHMPQVLAVGVVLAASNLLWLATTRWRTPQHLRPKRGRHEAVR